MARISLNCGCEVDSWDETTHVRYKSEECDDNGFHNAVVHAEYCLKCAERLKSDPDYIGSDEEADAWLKRPQEEPFERFGIECLSGDGTKIILIPDIDDPTHLGVNVCSKYNIEFAMIDADQAEELGRALFHFARSSRIKKI